MEGPAVWYADELGQHPEQWTFTLSEDHIRELEAAVEATEHVGSEIQVGWFTY